jgi:hypothetical protein
VTDIIEQNENTGLISNEELDRKINEITTQLMGTIEEDRDRAEQLYLELLAQFYQGKNTPDDLRELNKAQEMIQSTTDQVQKVLANLTKIKSGDIRIAIAAANIEARKISNKDEDADEIFDIKELNSKLDELETEKEGISDKD